jgi:predicted small lipoprotein YifL
MRKHWAALAAAITIASLAACGGGGGDSGNGAEVANIDDTSPDATTDGTTADTTADAPTDPEEAMLAFTECMRDHGVDMPDPQMSKPATGGAKPGNAVIAVEGDPNDPTFQKANEACEPLMANMRSELEDDPERLAEMKADMREFAQCMRDHGVDMPDPTFDENGRIKMTGPPPDAERDSDAFNAAAEECNQGEGGPMIQVGPGGGSDAGVATEQNSSDG